MRNKRPAIYDVRKLPVTINTETAAAILGCHPTWVRKLLTDGEIKGFRNGKNWRVNTAALLQYIGNEPQAVQFPGAG